MWWYKDINRESFEKRKDFVEQIMINLGCEKISKLMNVEHKTTSHFNGNSETWTSNRPTYFCNNGYFRVDEVLLEQPCIVLEYADTLEEVLHNCMEDAEPFPYDLSDEEIAKEVSLLLGIEFYPG